MINKIKMEVESPRVSAEWLRETVAFHELGPPAPPHESLSADKNAFGQLSCAQLRDV